jgi:hypothetical protein
MPAMVTAAVLSPHAQHDDLAIKVAALEQFIQTQQPSHLAAFNPSGVER